MFGAPSRHRRGGDFSRQAKYKVRGSSEERQSVGAMGEKIENVMQNDAKRCILMHATSDKMSARFFSNFAPHSTGSGQARSTSSGQGGHAARIRILREIWDAM